MKNEIENKSEITIVNFEEKYTEDFKNLNQEWIEQYFEMEENDYKVLNSPKDYIIENGGEILVALYKNKAVGVCALVKTESSDYDFELAKMAVSPKVQGQKIGFLLGTSIIKKAKDLGAKTIYLESNSKLIPAINLYRKLGFVETKNYTSPYKRADIQMVLSL